MGLFLYLLLECVSFKTTLLRSPKSLKTNAARSVSDFVYEIVSKYPAIALALVAWYFLLIKCQKLLNKALMKFKCVILLALLSSSFGQIGSRDYRCQLPILYIYKNHFGPEEGNVIPKYRVVKRRGRYNPKNPKNLFYYRFNLHFLKFKSERQRFHFYNV